MPRPRCLITRCRGPASVFETTPNAIAAPNWQSAPTLSIPCRIEASAPNRRPSGYYVRDLG